MRIDVTVNGREQLSEFQEACQRAGDRCNEFEVRYFMAPPDLSYVVPFPIVSLDKGDVVLRQCGEDGFEFFQQLLAGTLDDELGPDDRVELRA